jgi:hypothetical protein
MLPWEGKQQYDLTMEIILRTSQLADNKPYTHINHRGTLYVPSGSYIRRPCVYYLVDGSPYYDAFSRLLQDRQAHAAYCVTTSNWLSTGLAMCNSFKDINELFPEFILNHLPEYVTCQFDFNMATVTPKFIAFREKNKEIEKCIRVHALTHKLTRGMTHENPF